jgi:hypothetical protein
MKLLGNDEGMPQLEAKLADAGAAYAAVEATAQQQLEVPVQTQQLLAIEKLKKVRAGKEGGIWWAGLEGAVAIAVPAVAEVGSSNHWHSRCWNIIDPSSSTTQGTTSTELRCYQQQRQPMRWGPDSPFGFALSALWYCSS